LELQHEDLTPLDIKLASLLISTVFTAIGEIGGFGVQHPDPALADIGSGISGTFASSTAILGAMGGFGLQYGVEGTEQIVSQHLQ
jgi:hypothetical protein